MDKTTRKETVSEKKVTIETQTTNQTNTHPPKLEWAHIAQITTKQ